MHLLFVCLFPVQKIYPKLMKKQPVNPATVSLSDKVWVIPTSHIPHEYQELVANKYQEACQYCGRKLQD
jgi:hypothetical protein